MEQNAAEVIDERIGPSNLGIRHEWKCPNGPVVAIVIASKNIVEECDFNVAEVSEEMLLFQYEVMIVGKNIAEDQRLQIDQAS